MKKPFTAIVIIILLLSIPFIKIEGRAQKRIVLLKDTPSYEIEGLEIVGKSKNGYIALYSGNQTLPIPHTTLRTVRDEVKGYHTYETLTAQLKEYEENYPDLLTLQSIGKTLEGRDIWAVRIGKEQNKRILFIGCHHAREWMSVEIPLKLIDYLLTNYKRDERVKRWVDSIEIWVIPMLNPDGHTYSVKVDRMWRKNRRDNGDGTFGVDNNRNYGYMWGLSGSSGNTSSETYRGPYPFSELENQAIRNLAYKHPFNLVVSYHSFSELILYPWGYTKNPPPDEEIFERIAEDMAKTTGPPNDNDYPGPYDYYPMQSSYLYTTSGDSDDWFYGDMGTLSFTIELNSFEDFFDPPPEKIEPTWEQTKGIAFTALDYTGINGLLKLHIERENGELYNGDVYIEEKGIRRKTQKEGLFMYFLLPGTYTINVRGVKKKITIKKGEVTEETMIVSSKVNLNINVYSENNKIPLTFTAKIGNKEIEGFGGGTFENLEPDKYTLEVYSQGFYPFKKSIDLKSDKSMDIILKPKKLFVSKFDFPDFEKITKDKNPKDYQYVLTDRFPSTRMVNFVIFNKNPDSMTVNYFGIRDLRESKGDISGLDGSFKDKTFTLSDGSSFVSKEKPIFTFEDGTFASVEKNRNIYFSFNPSDVGETYEFFKILESYLYENLKTLEIEYPRYTNKESIDIKIGFLRNGYIKINDKFYYTKDGSTSIKLTGLNTGENKILVEGFVNDKKVDSKEIDIVVDKLFPEIIAKEEQYLNGKRFLIFKVHEENLKDVSVSTGEIKGVVSENKLLKTYYVKLNPIKDGNYYVKITAEDMAGNRTEKIILVHYDTTPPKIEYIHPKDGEKVNEKEITITGRITEDAFVYINGQPVKVVDKKFEFPVTLSTGLNLFKIKILDLSLNTSIYYLNIVYEGKRIILKIGDTTAWIGSNVYKLEFPPFIKEGRTFVPLRFIVEGLGGKVEWYGEEKKIVVKFEDTTLILWIGKREALLNNETVCIDPENENIYPIILNGRTFIPLRFVAESLGFSVEWEGDTKTIIIYRDD